MSVPFKQCQVLSKNHCSLAFFFVFCFLSLPSSQYFPTHVQSKTWKPNNPSIPIKDERKHQERIIQSNLFRNNSCTRYVFQIKLTTFYFLAMLYLCETYMCITSKVYLCVQCWTCMFHMPHFHIDQRLAAMPLLTLNIVLLCSHSSHWTLAGPLNTL